MPKTVAEKFSFSEVKTEKVHVFLVQPKLFAVAFLTLEVA